jgi:hypothetical protein
VSRSLSMGWEEEMMVLMEESRAVGVTEEW